LFHVELYRCFASYFSWLVMELGVQCFNEARDRLDVLVQRSELHRSDPLVYERVQAGDVCPLFRRRIVEWMFALHCSPDAVASGANLFDRYMALGPLTKGEAKLAGVAAIVAGSKLHDNHGRALSLAEIAVVTGGIFPKEMIKRAVTELCAALGWQLLTVSASELMQQLFECTVQLAHRLAAREGKGSGASGIRGLLPQLSQPHARSLVISHAQLALNAALCDHTFLGVRQSALAVAAVQHALRGLGMDEAETAFADAVAELGLAGAGPTCIEWDSEVAQCQHMLGVAMEAVHAAARSKRRRALALQGVPITLPPPHEQSSSPTGVQDIVTELVDSVLKKAGVVEFTAGCGGERIGCKRPRANVGASGISQPPHKSACVD
jgi:hypothetical protein